MNNSDVYRLALLWVRMFQPWMWSKKTNNITANGKHSGLFLSIQEQIEFAMSRGWSVAQLEKAFRDGKERKFTGSVYKLITESVKTCIDVPKTLINGTEDYTHHELIDDAGQIKPVYTLIDIIRYMKAQTGINVHQKTMKTLVDEIGLDLLLFCIDEAHYSSTELRSPYGLRMFLEDAKYRQRRQKDLRLSLEAVYLRA